MTAWIPIFYLILGLSKTQWIIEHVHGWDNMDYDHGCRAVGFANMLIWVPVCIVILPTFLDLFPLICKGDDDREEKSRKFSEFNFRENI